MKTQTTIEKTFNGKTEYLAWREAWRKHYALLSEQIREQKRERKNEDPALRASAQCSCWMLRKEATALLEKRKQSKIEAQRQYLATKTLISTNA